MQNRENKKAYQYSMITLLIFVSHLGLKKKAVYICVKLPDYQTIIPLES